MPNRPCSSSSWAWWGSEALAATLHLDSSTAIAFLGLGVLLATGVLTLGDIAKQGDVLATFLWFAVLFTLSSQLNGLGFMEISRPPARHEPPQWTQLSPVAGLSCSCWRMCCCTTCS